MPNGELIRIIRRQYHLPWSGIHGVAHWARVLENGVRLAERTGANQRVVRLFAVFHDCGRVNEDYDQFHGRRGAELAATLRGTAFQLSDTEWELFQFACIHHTDGLTEGDATVQTCWDADRLDLGRVGIEPDPRYLCTPAAKQLEMISWAYQRSITRYVPNFIATEWECAVERG